jgi:hypothetical protein
MKFESQKRYQTNAVVAIWGLKCGPVEKDMKLKYVNTTCYAVSAMPLLGTIASSGHVHKCPEKSRKSKVFDGWRVHPHPVKFVAIDGIRRYF